MPSRVRWVGLLLIVAVSAHLQACGSAGGRGGDGQPGSGGSPAGTGGASNGTGSGGGSGAPGSGGAPSPPDGGSDASDAQDVAPPTGGSGGGSGPGGGMMGGDSGASGHGGAGGIPSAPDGGSDASDARDAAPPNDAGSGVRMPTFVKTRLNPDFYSEGMNIGDINRDGKPDIVAGPYWYPGPDYTTKMAFRQPRATPFAKSGDSDCYLIFVFDFNQDGWSDILSFRQAGGAEVVWYENPKGAAGTWTEHVVFSASHDESPSFGDIDGDDKPELITVSNGYGGLAVPDWTRPNQAWTFKALTAKGSWGEYTHGLGTGDVNGDGRLDLLLPEGWWERPAGSATPWMQHAASFWGQELSGETYGGAQMFVDDVDGDGDKDIVTSLQAHGWGLAWFENQGTGFAKHMIMNTRADEAKYGVAFSQPHALALVDLNGDGLLDIVTGKRKGAHGNGLGAAELDAPAVLYWFMLVREPGQTPHYQPFLIDSEAGVGTQLIVTDVDGDGRADILTAARAGAYVFFNR